MGEPQTDGRAAMDDGIGHDLAHQQFEFAGRSGGRPSGEGLRRELPCGGCPVLGLLDVDHLGSERNDGSYPGDEDGDVVG
jgi:hypothetical protein